MTTPTPTHASAVLGMERALRKIAGLDAHQRFGCTFRTCSDYCPVGLARAALATWEQRPRLRDDLRVVDTLFEEMNVRGFDADRSEVRQLLDELQPVLFGTGPHPGGEPAKESE